MASGGTGTIYRAYDLRLQKIWAAKRVGGDFPIREEFTMGKLADSAFPGIVDVVEQEEERFLIMEWIEGETLAAQIERDGVFAEETVIEIGICLAKAIQKLHQMQPPLLYLDCKPSNVMKDSNGKIRLIDFGSALEAHTPVTKSISASPGYAAPEQLSREIEKRCVDVRTDVFGLGRTLYALLCGADRVAEVVRVAKERNIPIRVGVNSGSLEKDLVEKYHGVTAEGIVESALDKVHMIEDLGYDNLVISIKSSDVMMCVHAHELLAGKTPYPLHVGITESGTVLSGNIKSAIGLGLILNQGIGDTIRVSLTGDVVEEIKSAKLILRTLGLRKGGIEVVSCPTCGRTKIDQISLANQVEALAAQFPNLDIKVAVMGCVVNGPGEAKEADLGIAGGIGEGLLIKKGQIIRKIPEAEFIPTLRYELEHWNEQ